MMGFWRSNKSGCCKEVADKRNRRGATWRRVVGWKHAGKKGNDQKERQKMYIKPHANPTFFS